MRSKLPIDVLFADINLGGSVSGWEVAERFRMDRPDRVVLYTSGNGIDLKRCSATVCFSPSRIYTTNLERLRAARQNDTMGNGVPLAEVAPPAFPQYPKTRPSNSLGGRPFSGTCTASSTVPQLMFDAHDKAFRFYGGVCRCGICGT